MLDKDIIKKEIIPYLSHSDLGSDFEIELDEIIQAIFYRLKTGCQWRELPVKQFVTRQGTTWNAIYYHFNKWSKDGSWEKVWVNLLKKYRKYLDMSCVNIDGSHTKTFCGGQSIGYQNRKKCRTTNMLFIIDNQGVILFCSSPISGNHHDLYEIEKYFDEMVKMAQDAGIDLTYIFMNGDPGFDSENFRLKLESCDIEANIKFNKKNGPMSDREEYFDENLYARRASCEHSFAWMDAFKGLLVRYEKSATNWFSMNLMGMMQILLRKIFIHI